MSNHDWTYEEGLPGDGVYLCRMDEFDDEPLTLTVRDGKAYKEDGGQRIVMGHEWLKIGVEDGQ